MQVHERHQREGLGDRAHGVLGQQRDESDGLVAQLAADCLLRVSRQIALVEQQIKHSMHARQPGPQTIERGRLDVEGRLAQPVACARQALVHVRLGGKEPQRDFRGAESAERLQCEHQLRFPRNGLVTADEKHAEHVVRHLASEMRCRRRLGAFSTWVDRPLHHAVASGRLPQVSHQIVGSHSIQPGAGVIGTTVRRPGGQCS